jgi:hypothetical protein
MVVQRDEGAVESYVKRASARAALAVPRLRELGLRTPVDVLVPAVLATLDDLESGRLLLPT